MTYETKEELFRFYLDGKITALKTQQRKALEKLYAAEFGSEAYFSATHEHEEVAKKLTTLNLVKSQFDRIFMKEES